MNQQSLEHLATSTLFEYLDRRVAHGRREDARVIALVSELDARGAYRERGYPSMYQYCLRRLHMAEASAFKRIRVGRAVRQFPVLLDAIEDGRLHPTAAALLAPKLTPANVGELIAAATHQTRRGVEAMLAARFPKADLPTVVAPLRANEYRQLDPDPVETPVADAPTNLELDSDQATTPVLVTPTNPEPDPDPVAVTGPMAYPRVTPLSAERFGLQVTIGREAHDLLRRAQELLGHAVQPNDVEQVLTRALATLVTQLERRKFGATPRPRARRSDGATRYVPSEVRREVWKRDGGRCTFVSANGHRWEARSRLEFDHVTPVAKGGRSTTANLRLRCRAHNAYEAERTYGAEFMRRHREAAARAHEAAARVRALTAAPRAG